MNHGAGWQPPHTHEPNPSPPGDDPAFLLHGPSGPMRLMPGDLAILTRQSVPDCYIVSTGHGTSGPFTFEGPWLTDVIDHFVEANWTTVDVLSADGFGTALSATELRAAGARQALLALWIDSRPLSREEGLVRLIVPDEADDALRQVKWVGEIRVR